MGKFDEVIDRTNTNSAKWDMRETLFGSNDVLPMWVADMDFKAPKEVNEALIDRAKHGVYGYTMVDQSLQNSIINWLKDRYNWETNAEWLSFSNGVVTSLHIAVQAFTEPGDGVLIQTPVYPPFYSVIETHERKVIKNELVYENGYYTIDFGDLEEKIKQAKLFMLCSPHNPVGRVWKKEELEKIAELALKHNVLIVSDEIHADLIFPGQAHIPIASLSEEVSNNTITCLAPSKTFNIPGLDASYCVTQNPSNRKLLDQAFNKQGFHNQLNTMGQLAMEAAYTHGASWVDELMSLIEDHYHYVKDTFEKEIPELKVVSSEGTYLLWVDCSGLGFDDEKELRDFFVNEARVGLNAGIDYGEDGKHFMRMNIGCPKETLEDGVQRIVQAVKNRK
jgi:cystathionine beta-lyase